MRFQALAGHIYLHHLTVCVSDIEILARTGAKFTQRFTQAYLETAGGMLGQGYRDWFQLSGRSNHGLNPLIP